MIVLIDNYDSFSYNLYQLIGAIQTDIQVIRNDEKTIAEIEKMTPSHIILSPGPGKPKNAGICEEAVTYFKGKVPILGVCLGHQAICEAFGSTISYAKQRMHGKKSNIQVDLTSAFFQGLPKCISVARYHSLAVCEDTLSEALVVTSRSEDGEIMSVQHKSYPIFGVQFHPESILTQYGAEMIRNFLNQRIRN